MIPYWRGNINLVIYQGGSAFEGHQIWVSWINTIWNKIVRFEKTMIHYSKFWSQNYGKNYSNRHSNFIWVKWDFKIPYSQRWEGVNHLTLSWRNRLTYMDWFLYDNGLRHERVKLSVVFDTETSHLIFSSCQVTGFFLY